MTAPAFDFQALAARASADNPDAELFELIEEVNSSSRRFRQVWTRLKGVRGAERSDALHRLAVESCHARERLAAARPATLEGLAAKLRHAIGKDRPAPFYAVQHAALRDALDWLEPAKPKRRRRAAAERLRSDDEHEGA